MSSSPEGVADAFHDDLVAPLKRNHACLNCKKRKTRCCGSRPVCTPCVRSHAHAVRSANKNNTKGPVLCCEWADDGDESDKPAGNVSSEIKQRPTEKKMKGSLGGKALEREKEKRRDEEKESLLARIAELESRLAKMSPSVPSPQQERQTSFSSTSYNTPESANSKSRPQQTISEDFMPLDSTFTNQSGFSTQQWQDESWNYASAPASTFADTNTANFDIAGLFLVPANWPPGLPSPFLLDHLVEIFFSHAPQLPRMIHRPTLLTRLRLAPTNRNFPHPSLLHAICAYAAPYTAWVNSLAPDALETSVEQHKKLFGNMESIEDFGLSQAELSQKSIRLSTQACIAGPGPMILEICQASIVLADLYFQKGMPLQGWIIAGTPPRLLKALEFLNKNRRETYKEPMTEDAKDSVEREERLATVWMAFIMDAGYTLNSYWNGGFDLDEVWCPLPVDIETFRGKETNYPGNSQTAHSPDVLTHHPFPDSFVLAAKASMLVSRCAKWVRHWLQRDIVPGDEIEGLRHPSFTALVNDIHAFQASVPGAMRSLFKAFEATPNSALDANIILVHVLPNIALCVVHEPFVDWHSAQHSHALTKVQRGFEGVLGILHLIPSNLDLTLVSTSVMILCLYTCGRLVANFVQRSLELQQYAIAVRHRADLQVVQNMLNRYGQKHALGQMMSEFLEKYLTAIQSGRFKQRGQICSGKMQAELATGESPVSIPQNLFSETSNGLPPLQPVSNHAEAMYRFAENKRYTGTSSDSCGPTPPGLSASGSGSSGAPTPNDMLDFSHHVEIVESSSAADAFFLPPSADHGGLTGGDTAGRDKVLGLYGYGTDYNVMGKNDPVGQSIETQPMWTTWQ